MAFAKLDPEQIIPGSQSQILTTSGGVALWAAPPASGSGAAAFRTWAQHLTDTVEGLSILRDAPYIAISDGGSPAAWEYYMPGMRQVYPPDLSAFTWANQGGATAVDTYGQIDIVIPASASDNVRVLEIAYPTPPFTLEALILTRYTATDYAWGLSPVIRDSGTSSTAKMLMHGLSRQVNHLWGETRWTNQTTYSTTNPTTIQHSPIQDRFPWTWYKVEDDNTNITFSISYDNKASWIQIRQAGRTAFLGTPTKLGFGANSRNSVAVYGSLVSWKVT